TSAATRAVQATSFNDSVFQAVLLAAILVCFGAAAADKAGFHRVPFQSRKAHSIESLVRPNAVCTNGLLESTTRRDAERFMAPQPPDKTQNLARTVLFALLRWFALAPAFKRSGAS